MAAEDINHFREIGRAAAVSATPRTSVTVTSAVLRPVLHLTDARPILFQANEAYWQSRRLVTVAACVGEADDGLSHTCNRDDCR